MIGFTKAFGNTFLRFGALGALFAAAYAYHRNESSDAAALQQAELDHAKLDAQMDEARLQVLQAQIEPHFLFNTLAHVRRLYQTDPKLAHDMLGRIQAEAVIVHRVAEPRGPPVQHLSHIFRRWRGVGI